jgi:pantoate--beta-alanine ligase
MRVGAALAVRKNGTVTASTPQVFDRIDSVRAALDEHRLAGRSIALVPTMGALHDGHLGLVERAGELADVVIVSIFVNPLQFSPTEDLDRYPRTLDADLEALGDRAQMVFAPSVSDMYPDGPTQTRVTAGDVGALYEGAYRAGHFDGVLTVVAKLLNVVQPQFALFGQKDAQQIFLVRQMVRDLNLPVSIEAASTVREADGLALSSRNRFLDGTARRAALVLSAGLRAATDAVEGGREHGGRSGRPGVDAALAVARSLIESEPAVKLDYLVAVDPRTFLQVSGAYSGPVTMLVAARVGDTRLIDNTQFVVE